MAIENYVEDRAPNGVRVVTLREVAVRSGVSVSTASRALTGARRVTPGIVERVQRAARALGYRPNEAARNLRLSRTMTIGCVYAHFWSPAFLDFMDGFGSVCQARDYNVITATARGNAELYRTLVHRLFERRMDALVVVLPPELGDAIQPYHAAGTPVLSVFTRGGDSDHGPLVWVDEDAAIAQTVTRLSELGHKRILHLSTLAGVRGPRVAALIREARSADIVPVIEPIPHDTPLPAIRAALKRQRLATKATAVLVDQQFLPELAEALADAGRAAPADVSVIVFSEARWVRSLGMPWSTIRLDLLDVGQKTAQLVLDWLDGTCPPGETIAGIAEFVERSSIGPVGTPRSGAAPRTSTARRASPPGEP